MNSLKGQILSIFGKSPPERAETTKTKTKTKTNTEQAKKKTNKNPKKAVKNKAIRKKFTTFSTADQVPPFMEIISNKKDDGGILLSPEQQLDFAILLLDDKTKSIAILRSTEYMGALDGAQLDTNYLSLRSRCKNNDYHLALDSEFLAPRSILKILYEHEDEKNGQNKKTTSDIGELARKFDALLSECVSLNVSDIHIEVRKTFCHVRIRKNGSLVQLTEWPVTEAREMSRVIYQVIADEKEVQFNEKKSQAASIERVIDGNPCRIRLETIPAYPNGFDVVMRILMMGVDEEKVTLDALGYSTTQVNNIQIACSSPVGAIIVSGITGSGKSTTIHTLLTDKIEKNNFEIKVIAIEDPPERIIVGSTQVPVNNSKAQNEGSNSNNRFAFAIKSAMRSDPDILFIGEVRDEDSAELLVKAVQSGHQVYTTLHTTSAIGIVDRLRGLGVPNSALGSKDFLSGLIYQNLIKTTCEECHISIKDYMNQDLSPEQKGMMIRMSEIAKTYDVSKVRFKNKSGCPKCDKGIKGRTVGAEVIVPDPFIKGLIGEGKDREAWDSFRENGGIGALDHAVSKMLTGLCDPFDVEAKLGLLTSNIVLEDNIYDQQGEQEIFGFSDKEMEIGDLFPNLEGQSGVGQNTSSHDRPATIDEQSSTANTDTEFESTLLSDKSTILNIKK